MKGQWWKEYGQQLHFVEGASEDEPPAPTMPALCGVVRKWELFRGLVPHLTRSAWCCRRCLRLFNERIGL